MREDLEREAFVHLLRLRQAMKRLRNLYVEEDDGVGSALMKRSLYDHAALLEWLGRAVEEERENAA